MKIYEALKEMIENGKTIKIPRITTYYKKGKVDWRKEPVILRCFTPLRNEWDMCYFPSTENQSFFSDEWEVVEEN